MASSSPPPSGRHVDVNEDPAVPDPVGEPGREGRGGRLRPAPPPVAHAPLLLGIDARGGEHPQGPEHADDESLTGRMWGCVCGWRGTVRDVSTRPFHPRVGDGGRLRRQRLARSDRDVRTEFESHLARAARPAAPLTLPDFATQATPAAGSTSLSPAAGPVAGPGRDRPRGPRRRLTLPRTPAGSTRTGADGRPCAGARTDSTGLRDRGGPGGGGRQVIRRAPSRGSHLPVGVGGAAEAASLAPLGPDDAARNEALAAAGDRARAARDELEAADAALDALVARAREEGIGLRSIARVTGVPHREAAARWGDPDDGSSL